MEMMYEVREYDTWGNPRDGFEVNDSFTLGEVEFSQGQDLLQTLVDENIICQGAVNRLQVEDLGPGYLEVIERSTGKPVLGLLALDD